MHTAVLLGGYWETGWKADRLKQLSKWLFVAPHAPHFGEIIKCIIRIPATHKVFVAATQWLKIALLYTHYTTDPAWVRNLAKLTNVMIPPVRHVSGAIRSGSAYKVNFTNGTDVQLKIRTFRLFFFFSFPLSFFFFAVGYTTIASRMFSNLDLDARCRDATA